MVRRNVIRIFTILFVALVATSVRAQTTDVTAEVFGGDSFESEAAPPSGFETLPIGEPEVLPPGVGTILGGPELNPNRYTPAEPHDVEGEETETIRERYANGEIKVQREVAQDEDENFVNHGSFKMWDPAGNLIVDGQYRYGERHGTWRRWYRGDETKLLKTEPFVQFAAPFVSQATFSDGQLQGNWIIYDSKHRKITTWTFAGGRRDGKSTWWYASGHKMRELSYRDGEIHGELLEWDQRGQLVTRDGYEEGRRLVKQIEKHGSGQKKLEGAILQPRLVLEKPDDWWNCQLAKYSREGNPEKHGKWYAWYPNGQKRIEGEYKNDRPAGKFTWWHENGQKSLVANYEEGRKTGRWTWWHDTGQKSIQGEYMGNNPVSQWTWWHKTGRVAQRIDFSEKGEILNQSQPAPEAITTPLEEPQSYRSVLRSSP